MSISNRVFLSFCRLSRAAFSRQTELSVGDSGHLVNRRLVHEELLTDRTGQEI